MSENAEKDFAWYVAHTYSGYENKVRDSLLKTIENNDRMREVISDVTIPVEEVTEIKNGKRRVVQHKLLPGYVFVRMIMTEDAWYVVRNTRGVTGFVGSDNKKPSPLSEEEYRAMCEVPEQVDLGINVGDNVRVLSGLFENMIGQVAAIDSLTQKLTVCIKMFSQNQEIELAVDEVIREKEE